MNIVKKKLAASLFKVNTHKQKISNWKHEWTNYSKIITKHFRTSEEISIFNLHSRRRSLFVFDGRELDDRLLGDGPSTRRTTVSLFAQDFAINLSHNTIWKTKLISHDTQTPTSCSTCSGRKKYSLLTASTKTSLTAIVTTEKKTISQKTPLCRSLVHT